jgi:transposase-like protein
MAVLDVLVQSKRNKHAALKLMCKLLKKHAFAPERLVTDDLWSYAPAARDLGIEHLHERGRWRHNGPRIRISRPDGGSARCSVSRAPAPRRNSSQPTPQFTTFSTSNAISRQHNHTARSAPRR